VHPQFFEASITIGLAGALAIYTLANGHRGRPQRLFIALLGSIMAWSGGVALSRLVADPQLSSIATQASFLGVFSLPPLWFGLALYLTNPPSFSLGRTRAIALVVPSMLGAVALLSNPWHHLFMREPLLLAESAPQAWAGPLFWVWVAWAYLLVFAGCVRYVGWSWRLVNSDARWRGALVCLASLFPLGGNIAHLLGLVPEGHDPTPLMLGAATVILFVADWRFRLLDHLPVARRDVIEQLRDGVVVADGRGMILDMNAAAEEMIGASREDLSGKPIVRAVAAQAVDRFDLDEAAFNRAVVHMCSSAGGFEKNVENYAGRHFEIRGAGVADSVGQVSGLYIIMRDITDRTRLEEVERESRRAQAVASLAAGIAHEVNNPLSYIRANVSHVMESLSDAENGKPGDPEELQSVLVEALEGIDRIGSIVDRIRRFTRTRGGERTSISIAELLAEAKRLPARTEGESIEILVEVADDLPPVLGVRDGLLEAILNLIDNARQAMTGSQGVIRMKANRLRQGLRIQIEDEGEGVPEALREQVFEPFFTTRSDDNSTGLGLAISAKLVADFGGTLAYEPAESGGACFVIVLQDAVHAPVAVK
jgi:PAS domain S-box-containing protein